ncbi:MAG: radical SAM protein [Planctomycetota bacterium]
MASLSKMKQYLVAKGLEKLLPALSDYSPGTLVHLIEKLKDNAIARMAANHTGDDYTLQKRIDASEGFFQMAKRKLPNLHPNTQRKLCYNLFFNTMHLGDEARERYRARHGEYPPFFLTISPSMACDLRCTGCYAWKYDKKERLSFEEMDRILTEAKEELGVYFVTLTGGEPTFYPELFPVVEKHGDIFFQMYTHGQKIDKAMARRIAELGNLYPAISIEGGQEETDARRGAGAYQKVLDAMANLTEAGALFGFSVTHTRWNHDAVCQGTFFDDMIAHGAAFGWFFQYIMYGKDPNPEMVPTAEQRYARLEAVWRFRREKPILVFDFWNDGESVLGCLAWGRKYVHITPSGYVEPCVFVHFAKDNIRDKGLVEILNSPVFKEARRRQPFTDDLRRPCPVIDHPEQLKYLVEKYGLIATDGASMAMIQDLYPVVCRQAEAYRAYLAQVDAEGVREGTHASSACLCSMPSASSRVT